MKRFYLIFWKVCYIICEISIQKKNLKTNQQTNPTKKQWQLIISIVFVEQTRSENLVVVYILYLYLCVPKKLYNSLLYPGSFFHLAIKDCKVLGSRGVEFPVGPMLQEWRLTINKMKREEGTWQTGYCLRSPTRAKRTQHVLFWGSQLLLHALGRNKKTTPQKVN